MSFTPSDSAWSPPKARIHHIPIFDPVFVKVMVSVVTSSLTTTELMSTRKLSPISVFPSQVLRTWEERALGLPLACDEEFDWEAAASLDWEADGVGFDPPPLSRFHTLRWQPLRASARGSAVMTARILRVFPLRCAFMSIILRSCSVVLIPAPMAPT